MPSLAAPAALGLLPLLGVLVALYMLKVRRSRRQVPSTLLWRALQQDPPANAPWQPPKRSLLLLLQLLILGLIILALARPFVPTDDLVGDNLFILLDRSASMAATDVEPSRLEAAKAEVVDLVRSSAGARVTLIAFADELEVLSSSESDAARVAQVVADIGPLPVRGRVRDALAFASALAEGQADAEIVVVSDGNFESAHDLIVPAPVRLVLVGESDSNQSVSALSITESAATGEPEAFVQVANTSAEPVVRRVETAVDGHLYDARDVEVPAGGRASFTLALPTNAAVVHSSLRDDGSEDVLSLDDDVWAVRAPSPDAIVTLLSDGNRYLETALGLHPTVGSITQMGSEALSGPFGLSDVTVLDGLVPSDLPSGNLLIIRPSGPIGSVSVVGEISDPIPEVVVADHSLVSGMLLEDMAILSAAAVELGPEWRPLVVAQAAGGRWPLIAEGDVEGRQAILVTFDLRESDLPLRPAFPLFIAAVVDALAPSNVTGLPGSIAPGETVDFRLSPRVESARIVGPTGQTFPLLIEAGASRFDETHQLGPYNVELETAQGPESLAFPVNLAAKEESSVRPSSSLTVKTAGGSVGDGPTAKGRREFWWPLGLACLALVVTEWAYVQRSALSRLIGSVASRDQAE